MENKKAITILIADDHQLFRSGIISLLENIHDIMILDEARDGEELIKKYFELNPDLIIVDISMPKISGIEAFREIKKEDPNVNALFLSMYESEDYIFYVKKVGGKGLLGKNVRKDELVYAIKTVADGKKYFGRTWDKEKLADLDSKFKNMADGSPDGFVHLTAREKDILLCIGDGLTSSEIADKYSISKRTVDWHRSKLMQKINATSLPQLIAYAIKYSSHPDIDQNRDDKED